MEKRKYFGYREFGHIACYCRNVGEEISVSIPLILRSRMMQRGEGSEKEEKKDRRTILREEKWKKKNSRSKKNRSLKEGRQWKEEGEVIKRSYGKNRIEAREGGRRNCSRDIVR